MSTSVLTLASKGDSSTLLLDLRVRSLFSSYFFAKAVLGYSKLTDYFHQLHMDRFIRNWAAGTTMQLIEFPRAFYKTTSFTVSTSMWVTLPVREEDTMYALEELKIPEEEWFQIAKLHNQDVRQLLAFETESNAKKKIGQIKWHYEDNQLFRALFPEIAYQGSKDETPWTNQCLRIRRVGYAAREEEGTFEGIGVGGALQSRHYDIVWEDDLVGEKAKKSEVVMGDTIGWHQRLNGCFVDATRQVRFLVSNCWGYADLNSWIRKNEPEFVVSNTPCWILNPDTGQDEAVFPVDGMGQEAYTIEALQKLAKTMTPYDFSCQYLNCPQMPGEREVSLEKLHDYYVQEDGQIICSCGYKVYPRQLLRYLHYDPSNAKNMRHTSCPAMAIIGAAPNKHLFLLDKFLTKSTYTRLFEKLYELNNRWKPTRFTYEDVGAQNMVEHHIRTIEKTSEHKAKHRRFPTILPIKTGNKQKEIRIREQLFPYIERGQFSVRRTDTNFRSQIETFPNPVLDHDYDLLDAISQGGHKNEQGVITWQFPQQEDEVEMQSKEEKALMEKFGLPYTQIEVAA